MRIHRCCTTVGLFLAFNLGLIHLIIPIDLVSGKSFDIDRKFGESNMGVRAQFGNDVSSMANTCGQSIVSKTDNSSNSGNSIEILDDSWLYVFPFITGVNILINLLRPKPTISIGSVYVGVCGRYISHFRLYLLQTELNMVYDFI